jgi:hypothetical protein
MIARSRKYKQQSEVKFQQRRSKYVNCFQKKKYANASINGSALISYLNNSFSLYSTLLVQHNMQFIAILLLASSISCFSLVIPVNIVAKNFAITDLLRQRVRGKADKVSVFDKSV